MTPSSRPIALGITLLFTAVTAAGEIPKPPDSSRVRQLVRQMRSGTVRVAGADTSPADAAKNRDAIKTVAEWLAYRIAQPPYNGEPVPREDTTSPLIDRSMRALFDEAEDFCYLPIGGGNQGKVAPEQTEYGAEMGKAIAVAAKVVLDNSAKPIERINAVRLMSIAARMPAADLVDPLLAVVTNEKISDAEKLYAFQGLRNLLEQSEILDLTVHIPALHRDLDKRGAIAKALSDYICQKRSPRDDRERAVIEFVRRHAVEAMARFKDAVLRKPNKDLIFRPGWTLARVFAQDPSVFPPFTMQEQTEAATGFCLMKIDPDLNLDVAAYFIAGVSVNFARAANLDSQRAARDGTLPVAPWKLGAARFSYALASWREAAKKPAPKTPFSDTAVSMANTAIALLSKIEKGGPGEATGGESQAVITWMTDNPPKAWAERQSALLFKDDPQSILPFANTAALKTPDPKGGDAKKEPPKKK
jgi:hypothetical protein